MLGQRIFRWQKIVKLVEEGKNVRENGKLKRISRVVVYWFSVKLNFRITKGALEQIFKDKKVSPLRKIF